MFHPDIMRCWRTTSRSCGTTRGGARRPTEPPGRRPGEVELRLCRGGDDPELERLAELRSGRPAGRMVVALVGGRVAAALPLAGGALLPTRSCGRRICCGCSSCGRPAP